MIINFTEARICVIPRIDRDPVTKVGVIVEHIAIAPGYNDIPDADWAQARESAKPSVDNGEIVEEWVRIEKVKSEDVSVLTTEIDGALYVPAKLKDISRPRIIEVVKNTYHIPTLKKWKDEEMRQDVRLELMKQLEQSTKGTLE